MGRNISPTSNTAMNLVVFLLCGVLLGTVAGRSSPRPDGPRPLPGPGGNRPVAGGNNTGPSGDRPVAGGNNTGPSGNKPVGATEDCSDELPNSTEASEALEICITLKQRTAKVAIPTKTDGQKFPVIFHLHGNGGKGDTRPFGNFLGDDCIIVAPDGYENSWNVYAEKSKADDTTFILDLIKKIGENMTNIADMDNVNIAGSSNGAALTYQLLINTDAQRTFKRAFPMVSSLIGPQYNDDQFWKFDESAEEGEPNNFSVATVPTFAGDFEYAHFHGTEDGTIKYDGQNPGPPFLNNAEVISAQLTDYIWAKAMGFTGAQIADNDGVDVGTEAKPAQVYRYLDGRCRHYKLIGEGHGTGPSPPVVQEAIREMILGDN